MRPLLSISLLMLLLFSSCKDDVELHEVWVKKDSPDTVYRDRAVGFSIGEKGFVGLGLDPYQTRADWWEYNSRNDQWTRKKDFPGGGRAYAFGTTDGVHGFVGLGYYGVFSTQESKIYNDVWQYDAALDQWTALPDAPFTTFNALVPISFITNNKLFVMNWQGLWSLDITSNTNAWQLNKLPPFISAGQKKGNAIVVENQVYVVVSTDERFLSDYETKLWKYNSQADAWSQVNINYLISSSGDVNWSFIGRNIYQFKGLADGIYKDNNVTFHEISYPPDYYAGDQLSAVSYSIGKNLYYYFSTGEYWQYIP